MSDIRPHASGRQIATGAAWMMGFKLLEHEQATRLGEQAAPFGFLGQPPTSSGSPGTQTMFTQSCSSLILASFPLKLRWTNALENFSPI